MGSISFRQGQKALACRLAHCVALTNDVAWKKPNQALLYLWCNIIVKPALIGSIFKLVMMKTRPWWWDQVGTPHLTHSAAPLLCPKIPGNRSGERPKTGDWACSAIVLYLLFRFVRFWTEYMYQLVSFFSRNMYVLCFLLSDKHFKNYLLAPKVLLKDCWPVITIPSLYPSIPSTFCSPSPRKAQNDSRRTSELKWTEIN